MLLTWMWGENQAVCMDQRREAFVSQTDEIKYTAAMKVDFPAAKAAAGMKIISQRC